SWREESRQVRRVHERQSADDPVPSAHGPMLRLCDPLSLMTKRYSRKSPLPDPDLCESPILTGSHPTSSSFPRHSNSSQAAKRSSWSQSPLLRNREFRATFSVCQPKNSLCVPLRIR